MNSNLSKLYTNRNTLAVKIKGTTMKRYFVFMLLSEVQ